MKTKICSRCKIDKSIEEFYIKDSISGKRKSWCKECQAKYIQEYKAREGEVLRDKWRKASRKYTTEDKRRNKTLRQYGLTEEDYNRMYDEQEGKCGICGKSTTLVVDHNHDTGEVRRLLCNKCNVGLGCFNDNLLLLQRTVDYIAGWTGVVPALSHKQNDMSSNLIPATN